jgi:hypothetical protein
MTLLRDNIRGRQPPLVNHLPVVRSPLDPAIETAEAPGRMVTD